MQYALVDGSARDAALGGYIFKRYARVARDNLEDFLVEAVNLFHADNNFVILQRKGRSFIKNGHRFYEKNDTKASLWCHFACICTILLDNLQQFHGKDERGEGRNLACFALAIAELLGM